MKLRSNGRMISLALLSLTLLVALSGCSDPTVQQLLKEAGTTWERIRANVYLVTYEMAATLVLFAGLAWIAARLLFHPAIKLVDLIRGHDWIRRALLLIAALAVQVLMVWVTVGSFQIDAIFDLVRGVLYAIIGELILRWFLRSPKPT